MSDEKRVWLSRDGRAGPAGVRVMKTREFRRAISRHSAYRKLPAPDHPPCRQMVHDDRFSVASRLCGQPSDWLIRRPGFADFFLCIEHDGGWP